MFGVILCLGVNSFCFSINENINKEVTKANLASSFSKELIESS